MSNILSFLSSHFDALKPRTILIEGLPEPLVFAPLNTEQAIAYVHAAKSKNAADQARGFAELLVATVKLESGEPAFPFAKGGPNPIEILTKRTPPQLFTKLVEELSKDTDEKGVEEAEKKSATPAAPSSSVTTSSQNEPTEPSPT